MHKEGTVVYEMETQYTKVSRTTGKEYKVWKFTAISPMDIIGKGTRKGKWYIIETPYQKVRFNLETEYKVTYEEPKVEEVETVEEKPANWMEEIAVNRVAKQVEAINDDANIEAPTVVEEKYNVFINSYDDFFNEENKELITKEPVSHSEAVTIDRGIDINLNHNEYYTSIEKVEATREKTT